jgi:hypothetical protein
MINNGRAFQSSAFLFAQPCLFLKQKEIPALIYDPFFQKKYL